MDCEFLSRLEQLNLQSQENDGFQIDLSDISLSQAECERSLIGKLIGDKVANFFGLKTALSSIWHLTGPLKIRELGINKYQFVFSSSTDKNKVQLGKAWTFDSQYLILLPWEEGKEFCDEAFSKIPLWIQIWNLPYNWISKEVGRRFSHVFEEIQDVIIPETGSKHGRHLKILAMVNISKPLLRGTRIKCGAQAVWVAFKYENLATFCCYCGRVGHTERNCGQRKMDAMNQQVLEGQYGPWLRAEKAKSKMEPEPTKVPAKLVTTADAVELVDRVNSTTLVLEISGTKDLLKMPQISWSIAISKRANQEILSLMEVLSQQTTLPYSFLPLGAQRKPFRLIRQAFPGLAAATLMSSSH